MVRVTDLPYSRDVVIELLLVSPLHRYEGRPADGPLALPGNADEERRDQVEIRAHLGVVGDRYFGGKAHVREAVTLMAAESLDAITAELGLGRVPDAALTRRNIIVRGVDVDALRGAEFSLDTGDGPVRFLAHRPANPCAWMNVTLAEGAHKALRGRGGMRCEPLADGTLALGPAVIRSSIPLADAPFAAAPII